MFGFEKKSANALYMPDIGGLGNRGDSKIAGMKNMGIGLQMIKSIWVRHIINTYFLADPAKNVLQTRKTLTFLLKMPTKTYL